VTGLTITITRVSGGVVAVGPTSTGIVRVALGLYAYVWAVPDDAALGDYAVGWLTGDGRPASDVVTVVASVLATSVTVQDVAGYMGATAARYAVVDDDATTYPQIADALAAEIVDQAGKVTYRQPTDTVPVPDNSDLTEALKRRVVRNLAMRALPTAMTQGDAQVGPVRIGGFDPEIRRLEAKRRKRPIA
jgi:hypothetical protein